MERNPETDLLPDERVPELGRRSLWSTIAWTSLVLVLVNASIPLLEQRVNRAYWLLEAKWQLLKRLPAPVDVVVVGDSTGNQAVIPSRLGQRLGMTAVNLCTYADMTLANDVWMLEEYLRSHGKPRIVVAVHAHDAWHRSADRTSLALVPRAWSYTPTPFDSVVGKLDLAVRRYLPLYARPAALTGMVATPVQMWSQRFELDPDGFMAVTETRELDTQLQRYVSYARDNAFEISPINRAALARLLQLSDQHGFRLYVANGPLYRPLYADSSFRAYLDQRDSQLKQALSGARHAGVIFTSPALFGAEQLESLDHVNVEGAKVFTDLLAKEISPQ